MTTGTYTVEIEGWPVDVEATVFPPEKRTPTHPGCPAWVEIDNIITDFDDPSGGEQRAWERYGYSQFLSDHGDEIEEQILQQVYNQ